MIMYETEVRHCPKCKKETEPIKFMYLGAIKYSFQRIDFLHYYCGKCNTYYINRKHLFDEIRESKSNRTLMPSIQFIYKEIMSAMKATFFRGWTFVLFPKKRRTKK